MIAARDTSDCAFETLAQHASALRMERLAKVSIVNKPSGASLHKYILLGSTSIVALALCLDASFSPANAACGANGPGNFTGQQTCNATNANFSIVGPSTITVPNTAGVNDGIHVEGTSSATATISDTTIINNDPTGPGSLGINVVVDPGGGNAAITMSGTNAVTTANGNTVLANNRGTGNATITITGTINTNSVAVNNDAQDGIEATTQGGGNASVDMSGATGTVRVSGGNGILIDSLAAGGNVTGNIGSGITVFLDNTTSGASGFRNSGIFVSTLGTGTINLTTAAAINTLGPIADGIRSSSVIGPVTITNSGPISTAGTTSNGINAFTTNVNNPGAAMTITNTGSIQTTGAASNGIVASKTTTGTGATGAISILNGGDITTVGTQSAGILATTSSTSTGAAGAVSIFNQGVVTTSGANSDGLRAIASGTTIGNATVTSLANVTASGNFSAGISAFGNATTVTVGAGAGIMGGWQADLTSVGLNGAPAAGVVFSSQGGGSILTNDGTIGALSDRAIFGDAVIVNNGTIIGFVQLTGVNDVFNNNIFDLRHFADTNGDGVRDTLRVAVSDLGSGPSTFTNNGTLALPSSPGATTLDSTGQYLPLGFTFNSMALGGPVQGQILGATTFTNAGTIDLQANPVPGDVLLISGGHTPGTTGGGTFIASGGRLLLDTVLNEGGANSQSDVLVVDGTAVGAGGATRLFAKNFGGAGALTPGDGILVMQSVDPGRSAPGVFTLGAPAVAGPYEYMLFLGGVGANTTNGNWYLRSTLSCDIAPNLPECQGPVPPGPAPLPSRPDYRIETSLYAAIPSLALLYGRNLLDTLHERVGDEFFDGLATSDPASKYQGWGRVIGVGGTQRGDSLGVISGGNGGPRFDYTFFALQAGMDFWRQVHADGSRDHAGAYFAIGSNQSSITHFDNKRGNSDFMAYTLGGYWTHFGPSGWYVDAILQGTYYDIDSTANRGLPAFRTKGQGIAASLEGGYPFKLGHGWFIEPQAQLIYQNISINDGSDTAAQIRFDDVESLVGRIGARFGRTWLDKSSQRPVTAWVRPNLWHEFRGNPITSFSSETGFIPFHADLGGLWGEINAGISGQVKSNTTVYANASYQSRFDGGGFAYVGKAGVRMTW